MTACKPYHRCLQGRRNVGPPQPMALGSSEQPAGQLQPSAGPQLVQQCSEPDTLQYNTEPATEDNGEKHRGAQGLCREGEAGSARQQAAVSNGVLDAEGSNSVRPAEGPCDSPQEPSADSAAASHN